MAKRDGQGIKREKSEAMKQTEECKKPDRESDKGTAASAPYLPGDLGAGTEDEGRLKTISGRKYRFGTSRLWRRFLRGISKRHGGSGEKRDRLPG